MESCASKSNPDPVGGTPGDNRGNRAQRELLDSTTGCWTVMLFDMKHFHHSAFSRVHVIPVAILAVWSSGCGIQSIPQAANQLDATFAEVTNQYKRRADLIPNLVSTVKGYASHESATLTAVTEARAKATATRIDPSNASAEQIQQFQAAQGGLSQALGRLMVVVERYPDLKADRSFRELQAQLEGTENRVTIARQRHIDSIRHFNDLVTVPPTSLTNSLFYQHDKRPQWSLAPEEQAAVEKPPEVAF